jgi:hypothetical protein
VTAQLLARAERLGLPAAAVQRQHPSRPEPLPQRVLPRKSLELTDQFTVPARRQLGVDPVLLRVHPELVETGRLRPGERLIGELGQRRASPQRQRLGQLRRRGGARIPVAQGDPSLGGELLEATGVHLVLVDVEQVARWAREDQAAGRAGSPPRLEGRPEAGDVVLQGRRGVGRRPIAPDDVDEPVERHHLVGVDQEGGQQESLLRAAEVDPAVPVADLEWAEHLELHAHPDPHATPRRRACPREGVSSLGPGPPTTRGS